MDESQTVTQGLSQDEHQNGDHKDEPLAWGILLPYDMNYPRINLTENSCTIGRQGKIALKPSCPFYGSISKIHFEIIRDGDKVTLLDFSGNGTFVNSKRVGIKNSVVLDDNFEISLCRAANKAFIFQNLIDRQPPYPSEVVEAYTITKKIGSGAYGEVKLAFKCTDQEMFAVKIIEKKRFNSQGSTRSIESEVEILRHLNHPCIIKLDDAIDTDNTLFIFMELVKGGELFDRVVAVKQFSDCEAKLLFYQMLLAIKYLHDNNICHRDMKPENILLVSHENRSLIKVTDFGLSKFFDDERVLKTMCGTPNYLAPEVLLSGGSVAYTPACDVWSMGAILFICLVGYPPFTTERTDLSLKDQIVNGKLDYPKTFWKDVSCDALNLVQRMLTVDPTSRITIAGILEHPWLQDDEMRANAMTIMYPNDNGSTPTKIADLSAEPTVKRRKV